LDTNPQVVFCGIASSLWIYEMRRMRGEVHARRECK
jgi:hypothetical protein